MSRGARRAPPPPAPRRAPRLDEILLAQAGQARGVAPDFAAIEAMLGAGASPAETTLARARRAERDSARLEQLRRAAAADPGSVPKLVSFATKLREGGRHAEALEAYRRLLVLDPANAEARHMVDALSGASRPPRAADDYVAAEFDAFADRYDDVLANWLDYRGPALIAAALAAVLGPAPEKRDVVDLGCGTGLLAPVLRPLARRLHGVDLSARMIEKARARGDYDALAVDEIGRFLAARPGSWTLAVAGDVFCYFGELAAAFGAVARALRPGGVFAFTVERHDGADGAGFVLRPTGRYAHADAFVRAAAAAAGLSACHAVEAVLRTENGRPVAGACYAFSRPGPGSQGAPGPPR